jgi:predicted AAA+ superfamily ATPase
MAVTNRDRIGQMLEILAPELDSFIQRAVESELPKGEDWTYVVETRDQGRGRGAPRTYSRTDPQLQLRMLAENVTGQFKTGWYPFDRLLSRSHKAMATELADCRNKWAHNDPFNTDDATRALDTAERLLKAINSPDAADKVQKIRLDLRRVAVDRDDQRVVKKAVLEAVAPGLRPWREVLAPHEDVATGNFSAAEFAADLFKVATRSRDTSRDYSDPVEFFNRTYLTEGLRNLIGGAVDRLGGDPNASPVVNLQTNFGGGKTHSMLALWHLAGRRPITDYPQDVQDLLNAHRYQDIPNDVKRVAIVGNHFAASGEPRGDVHVNTMWGELAWQLGGKEGYDLVRQADQTSTAPGEALHELLEYFAPAVILIDEWVAYARQLVGRDDLAGGTFETQFTFAQALTEAVKATPGVLLAISIPASHDSDQPDVDAIGSAEEVGGENGTLALGRLQNVVRRIADQWRPASADESYQIVRQRLFVEPNAEQLALITETARGFGEMYRKHNGDFPRATLEKPYEDRIKRSYPIHPELFDRLYGEWSTLERFQRTRGVLRLMNTVIHALWTGGDTAPLIMPGSIPLNVAEVNAELTGYLPDSWKAVIDADVAGPQSTPARIDNARTVFGQRSLTQRLARTVFFGAAPTLGSAHKGLETARVFVGTAMPGDVIGNFHSALTALADTATYFYSSAGRYWYDLQANISRTAKDHAERLHEEDVWAEIDRRLTATERRNAGAFAAVQIAPAQTGDIPDVDEVRLVIVHPRAGYTRREGLESPAATFALAAAEKRGAASRIHRNMVAFLAADADRLTEVDAAVRAYLGWQSVSDRAHELGLTLQQIKQASERQERTSTTVDDRIAGAYHWILAPDWPPQAQSFTLAATKAEGAAGSLAEKVSKRMVADSTLNRSCDGF